MKRLRINVIGDGSAGRRHASILASLGHSVNIIGPGEPHGRCDAAVIASPPKFHTEHLQLYAPMCPVLCEGPVTWCPSKADFVHMIAANWLFVPSIKNLRQLTSEQLVTHAHLWFDYDLALWRGAGWDYKSSCYYDEGLDYINLHEMTTAIFLFGSIKDARVMKRKLDKSLGVDVFCGLFEHSSGVLSTINCGWHANAYNRGIRVFFADGRVDTLNWYSPQHDSIVNQSYRVMVEHWLRCIDGKEEWWPTLQLGHEAFLAIKGGKK